MRAPAPGPTVTPGPPGTPAALLPRLREELQLISTAAGTGADSEKLIYDPLRHRYVRIDADSFDLLTLWREHERGDALAAAATARFARYVGDEAVAALARFLVQAELAVDGDKADWKTMWQRQERSRQHWLLRLTHSYLFFRVPLFAPDRFLAATLPWARAAASPLALRAIGVLGLVGLYLASRRWDEFLGTYQHVFTPTGALCLGLVVVLVKALHELGHAYVATHYGCRVPTLGIAFMVMMPMLYTDVTDAWRLGDRRARMRIDAAGILVEIGLACLALFTWAFLPEGPAKSAAFLIATASLVMTLALNLNPLMRFDGYYLLADAWDKENLQDRAFALTVWRIRDVLFASGEPCPETVTPPTRRLMILYAWCVWLYRLIVFTGIALLVYHMFFKALGLALFAVEIVFFIALPIVRELRQWWRARARLWTTPRALVTAGAGIALMVVAVVPWSSRIELPAIIELREVARIFPPRAARIATVDASAGQGVMAHSTLIRLEAPELDSQIRLARIKLELLQLRLERRTVDVRDREQSLILEDEIRAVRTRLEGLQRERAVLTVEAPVAGDLLEVNPTLHAGRWISKSELIAVVGTPERWIVRGYAGEHDARRISIGARGTFVPHESPRAALEVVLAEIARAGAPGIELPELMSLHGGAIAVEDDRSKRAVPLVAQYLVTLRTDANWSSRPSIARGTVFIEGAAQSFAARLWRNVVNVVIREMSF